MRQMKNIFVVLITSIVVCACATKSGKENTISISGAFALYPLVVTWAEEYQKENPHIRFNISGGGAGKGMADALAQTVDLGMFSREIAQAELEKGVWWIGLTIDAVVPTISSKNPNLNIIKTRGVSRDEFKAIFIDRTITSWGDLLGVKQALPISVYTRSDACGAAGTWAKYLGGKQENILGVGIYGDPGLADAVIKDISGITYNNTIFAYDVKTGKKREGIEIIPIDINENGKIDADEDFYDSFDAILQAIGHGVYPAPPARELYFVANGKPQKEATLNFIRWACTKGQAYVKNAGYVPVDSAALKGYLNKL